jgi:cytochrome c-type biogenesis protein CcsB
MQLHRISPPRRQDAKKSEQQKEHLDSAKKVFLLSFSKFLASWRLGGGLSLLLLFPVLPVWAGGLDFKTLSLIPIQDGGRVKPLDTFARESVRSITGHERFEGRDSMDTVMDWITRPKDWETKNFILVENLELRSYLHIPQDQKQVAPSMLKGNEAFIAFAQTSYAKQQKKMTLNPEEKEALALFGRLQRYVDIQSGEAWNIIPVPDSQNEKWASIGELYRSYELNKTTIPEAAQAVLGAFKDVLSSYNDNNSADFSGATRDLSQVLLQIGGKDYASPSRMSLETQFNALKPFRWAWIIHLAAALLIGFSFFFKSPKQTKSLWTPSLPGLVVFIIGIGFSLYGFILRCVIAGRPPVSNMYESLIWVTFGMTVFALVFELIFRVRFFILAGSILAVVGFILADNVPTVLDSSIQPIEPVLRSNFWLTIHVLTITLSYAAFLLSLGIGHVCLWFLWFRGKDKEALQKFTKLLYRVVQVGVVLLAAGTILGGVWANYSWGRFWGWDPKETWALIALLGYVAILHGRLAGWLRETGFTIGVVSAFLGVLMAWYGVNFVLGVGLHSYGFSKGGLPYVISFVLAEIILVTAVGLKTRKPSPAPAQPLVQNP